MAAQTFTDMFPSELWIVYLWSATEPPSYPFNPKDIVKMEMIMTATYDVLAESSWHMGINRNYWWTHCDGLAFHKNASIPLHAYAAKVIHQLHPEAQHVKSDLMEFMAQIFVHAFPEEVGRSIRFEKEVIAGNSNPFEIDIAFLAQQFNQ